MSTTNDWLEQVITTFIMQYDQKLKIGNKRNIEAVERTKATIEAKITQLVNEARYMGSMDFANWVMAHDESSFRSDRAWFKIKPKLITEYQANMLKDLEKLGITEIRTNTGVNPDATVPQLQSKKGQ